MTVQTSALIYTELYYYQGLPQYIQISFPSPVTPKCLAITFQGGFVGTRCVVDAMALSDSEKQWHTLTRIYPEDVNRRQVFDLIPVDPSQALAEKGIDCLRLLFEESSDFFGRITVYDLEIQGHVSR